MILSKLFVLEVVLVINQVAHKNDKTCHMEKWSHASILDVDVLGPVDIIPSIQSLRETDNRFGSEVSLKISAHISQPNLTQFFRHD